MAHPTPAVAKALDRLAAATAAGAPYEGQQVIKTVSARLRARGAKGDAADLTEAGAVAQLGAGQVTCGAELAAALLDTYTADGVRADEPPSSPGAPPPSLGRVLRLLDAFAAAASHPGAAADAARFAAAAVKWARASGASGDVLARLHLACAAALDAAAGGGAAGLAAAAPHWARARSPAAFAAAVVAASAAAPVSERGAWLARAALQTAATAGDGGDAAAAVADAAALLAAAAEGASPPADVDPYAVFARLFVDALGRGSPALAATVAREFGPALERAGDLPPLAERACGAVFGGGGGGGPGLGDLMRALGGGG